MIHINSENFEKEVVKSKIPVIIDFFAEWCMPCKMMAPIFEELSKEMKEGKFAKLNTEEEPEITSKFSVQGIPALIITEKGKEVGRLVGFMPKDVLKEKIKDFLK